MPRILEDFGRTRGGPGLRDNGNTTATATIVVGSTPACAWACCPFTNGTGCNLNQIGEQCP